MTRNWSPLAATDPIPGDPGRVADLVRRLRDTANEVHAQGIQLRDMDSGWWKGRAADAFVEHQQKVPPLLNDVALRYFKVANALDAYHPQLESAQSMAEEALVRAKAAEAAIEVAQQGLIAMQQHAHAQDALVAAHNAQHPNQSPAQPAPWHGPHWPSAMQQAQEDMDAARRLLDDARSLRDESASRTAAQIRDTIDDDLANEGGFSGFVKRTARTLVDVLPIEELSTILSVVGAALVVISLFIPGVNLITAGFILAGLAFATDAILFAADEKSAMDLTLSAFGFMTAGVGFAASRLATKLLPAVIRTSTASTTMSRSTTVVVSSRAGHTVVGIRQVTQVTRVVETVSEATRLPAVVLFPSLKTVEKAVGLVDDALGLSGSLELPNFPAAVIEIGDEILFEMPKVLAPMPGVPGGLVSGIKGGLHQTPDEAAEERASAP